MDRPLRIAAFAASTRRGSLNRALLDRAVAAVGRHAGEGVEVDVIDLGTMPLPIFDGDLQARDGVPVAAQAFHDRIAASDAVLVASPEYNGGYPPLFKNTLDWASRIDMFFLHKKYVGILSTTPGGGGGARGAKHLEDLFANIFVTTHEPFTLPKGNEAMSADGWTNADERQRLSDWAEGFVAAAIAKTEAVAAES